MPRQRLCFEDFTRESPIVLSSGEDTASSLGYVPWALCVMRYALRSVGQPFGEDSGEARFQNGRLCFFDVVRNAEELHGQFRRVEDQERRLRVAVAGLTDGAGVDQVAQLGVETERRVAAH